MPDQIKYIIEFHSDTMWENDHHYIAKQGSNGPIDLTEAEVDEAVRKLNESSHTMEWHTPRSAPKKGEMLRLWVDECGGFEHTGKFFAGDFDGCTVFRDMVFGKFFAAALWRYADKAPRPSPELVARSHTEFEEDDT